jgi:hypothetical protein
VCAELADAATRERELRALVAARAQNRRLPALLLTLSASDAASAQTAAPKGVTVRAAWEWLLLNKG